MIIEIFGWGLATGILLTIFYVMMYYCQCLYEEKKYQAKRRWFCDSCKKKMDYLRELR